MQDSSYVMVKRGISGRADRIGLRGAMSDRLLPFVVAAMSFLAALALTGNFAAGQLAVHWLGGARKLLIIEVPDPGAPVVETQPGTQKISRIAAAKRLLETSGKVIDARILSDAELAHMVKPWLGSDEGATFPIALPGVIVAHSVSPTPTIAALTKQLSAVAPKTLIESGQRWSGRLVALTNSLRACAFAVLILVALVAASVVIVTVRAGLAQRREAIEIIHGLGAQDADIARQFAARAMHLTALGGLYGALASLPALIWLGSLAAGFSESSGFPHAEGALSGLRASLDILPAVFLAGPLIFTIAAAIIGWAATQVTVHGWLRRLS